MWDKTYLFKFIVLINVITAQLPSVNASKTTSVTPSRSVMQTVNVMYPAFFSEVDFVITQSYVTLRSKFLKC